MSAQAAAAPAVDRLPSGIERAAGEHAARWAEGAAVRLVLFPRSVDEVVEVVRWAREEGVTLLPAGHGSWLGAGGWGRNAAAAVSTAHLDEVQEYEPADLTLTAESGATLDELNEVVEPNGQWLPFDAPGSFQGTLGGAVASGASGPLRSRYGAVRDNVLGLEVVTGDARLLRIGGRVVKNVAGYDLVRLMTGSRGSLGLITKVSVRLYPLPETDLTIECGGEPAEVAELARAVFDAAVPVTALEVDVDGPAAAAGSRPSRAQLVARMVGGGDEVRETRERFFAAGGVFTMALMGPASREWHEQRTEWEDDAELVARLAALPDRLERSLELAREVAGPAGGRVRADALTGLVRVAGDAPDHSRAELADRLAAARAELESEGGSLTLSRAPAALAERVGWCGADPGAKELAARIKALFDPDSVLGPRCP